MSAATATSFSKNRVFAEAYNDLYPVVFSAVYSKVSSMEDAEDLCQEIFLQFYNKMEVIDNARKWLYGALRLEIMAYYRRRRPDATDIDDLFDDVGLTFVNGFRDTRIMIQEALEDMGNFEDEREKILFDLIAVRNYTYEEAGAELGFSKRQVRYRYGLIVSRLQEYFRKKGIASLEELL